MPPSRHANGCPSVFNGAYCGSLGEAAALCVQENERNHSWEFTSCLLANNGWSTDGSVTALASNDEFTSVIQNCSKSVLSNYSLDALQLCYTGAEGNAYRWNAYTKSRAKSIEHPSWVWVNGEFIDRPGKPDPTADLTDLAQQIKAKICGAYKGDLPSTCEGLALV